VDYDEYVDLAQRAAQFVEAGEHEQALDIFRALISSDISDVDKAMMCHNTGVVQEKMGREQEALSSYERGMSYERPHGRSYVAEQRAGYLYRLGRLAESLRANEELSHRPSLSEEERQRMRHNMAALREQIG
jgi:tetratricopeptide (TPR) repeat protein